MAESVISFVAPKLFNLLIEEVNFLRDVEDQVKWMQEQLKFMQDHLRDAKVKRYEDAAETWLEQLREVAFDVEDVVDTYILNMHLPQQQQQKCQWFARYASIFQKCLITHQTGEEIEHVKERLGEIFKSKANYGIDFNSGPTQEMLLVDKMVKERRKVAFDTDINYFVDFEADKEKIIGILLDEKVEQRCVVSIVGIGGAGKTTFARNISKDNRVRTNFCHRCALVSVSRTYTIEGILEDIAKAFPDFNTFVVSDENQSEGKLTAYLRSKKYLIILDDIWDTHVWINIQHHLPDTNEGSRVIITTRMMDVATSAKPSAQPHSMTPLSDDKSWVLFAKIVFPGDESIGKVCPPYLKELRESIVKKCAGLPLAVVVIGGLLSNNDRSVWHDLVDTIDWEKMGPEKNVCSQILGLSYEDLPSQLKTCFMYFSCFPEDFVVDARKLIKLWVAEGFIPNEEKQDGRGKRMTMEETAELWLKDLIQRCLVQVVETDASDRAVRCRIHDLLLDLAIRKANEVNFVHIIGGGTERESAKVPITTRRIALHQSSRFYEHSGDQLPPEPKVRTFLCINFYIQMGSLEFVKRLKLIRVLDLHHVKGERVLPEAIGDLIHLRYLGLRGTRLGGVTNIPSSVGKLQNLQTLDAGGHVTGRVVPNSVWEMGSLRHVIVPNETLPHEDVGKHLVNLQTFHRVRAGSWIQESLGVMTNLRSLQIYGISRSHCRVLSKSLGSLLHLRRLKLVGPHLPKKVMALTRLRHLEYLNLRGKLLMDDDLEDEMEVPELPPNLRHIKLSVSRLQQDPLLLLGTLKFLRRLQLEDIAYTGEEVVCSADAFPQLERLEINDMPNLKCWKVEDGAMPRLKYLEIFDCKNLKALPDGLRHSTDLHELVILYMPREFVKRLDKKEGADWPKIRHVPIVRIEKPIF